MSCAKTSHRIRRAKNARTGNQILLRKLGAAFGRAAAKVTLQRIDSHLQQIRAVHEANRRFCEALHRFARQGALAMLRRPTSRGDQ